MSSMTKAKVAITVEEDVLARIRRLVAAGETANVSAFFEEAARQRLDLDAEWARQSTEVYAATGGPPTDDERAAVRRILSGRIDPDWPARHGRR